MRAHAVEVFWQRGPNLGGFDTGDARVVAVSVAPTGKRFAFVDVGNGRSSLEVTGVLGGPRTTIFSGAGTFTNVVWSPDGRWLLLDWRSADQWLFIRTPVKKLVAVSNIGANFGVGTTLVGWCCP